MEKIKINGPGFGLETNILTYYPCKHSRPTGEKNTFGSGESLAVYETRACVVVDAEAGQVQEYVCLDCIVEFAKENKLI